ncbi:MAG: hypothetical protein CVV30_02635 [Methanomicrobiales archaeon HGW-Methanomicrobiales-1]|jgi:hypothetical protein|nr:MAG: hypothetical protein CVV30_02635 [Methanomicrobiales archaeon HGW-Methanomicrobiales-1]
MVTFQSRTGLLLPATKGITLPDPPFMTREEQGRINLNVNRDRNLSITLAGISGKDETADILEVIAKEIRHGSVAGNDTKCSWTIDTFSKSGR